MSRRIIENTVILLLNNERFYAEMLLRMNVSETARVPTAGVNVRNGEVNLYINPQWWETLTSTDKVGVLKHGCLHALHCHMGRGAYSKNWNIATDVAINQLIPELQETIKTHGLWNVENFAKALKLDAEKIKPRESSEYYMELIQEHAENPSGSRGQGEGGLDDHSLWEEGDQGEAARAVVQDLVSKAKRGAGSVPGDLQGIVDKLLSNTLNWRAILRRFVANAEEYVTTSTRHRRNRRYGIAHPGWRSDPILNVVVCTDSSGSVGDDEYTAFCAEIDAIHRAGTQITWIQADCQIQKVEKWKRGTAKVRSGYGGTAYSPALEKAKELRADVIIYFGDMDAADRPANPGIPVLWATVRGGKPPASFGKVVEVSK